MVFFEYVCTDMSMLSAGVQWGQKKASRPLELELQVVRSCLTWLLGFYLQSSPTAFFLVPCLIFKDKMTISLLSKKKNILFFLFLSSLCCTLMTEFARNDWTIWISEIKTNISFMAIDSYNIETYLQFNKLLSQCCEF